MGCNCGARGASAAQKWAVTGTGDPRVDRDDYENEASARLAIARSGKTGVTRPVVKAGV
jgi:hypothetical protein